MHFITFHYFVYTGGGLLGLRHLPSMEIKKYFDNVQLYTYTMVVHIRYDMFSNMYHVLQYNFTLEPGVDNCCTLLMHTVHMCTVYCSKIY